MVKQKAQSKKQQKRGGIDFKKIKRKVGRKLPPPKNATNTEIKSKAIILPEQSVVSEKAGLAVSKKGLTLKELLQQTSHHNAKVRKDALIGIRDIFLKYPNELKLHKLATIEKLRERISDDDKLVRETLYQLYKSVVLPSCTEDNQGPFISLMMAYIFNSMTHLAIEVRLMAFKFFGLVVQYYPSSFSFYAEKILQNYQDILQKSRFHLQDKSKLKNILAGLVHCLRLLPCNKSNDDSSVENEVPSQQILHALEPDLIEDSSGRHLGIIEKLKDLLPILVGCFQDFIPLNHAMPLLDVQSFDCVLFILQSIDIVVAFFAYEMKKTGKSWHNIGSHYGRIPDADTLDQVISPVIFKKIWEVFPLNPVHRNADKDDDRYFILNTIITEFFLRLREWNYPPPALLDIFLGFIESSLIEKLSNCTQSGKVFREKHLLSLVPFIPKLVMQISGDWRSRILQAFTEVFKNCGPESSMKLACLSALGDVLDPEKGWLHLVTGDPELLDYQLIWIRELPPLLVVLGDKNPSYSRAVLNLLLIIGKAAKLSISLSLAYDQMQCTLAVFYSTCLDDGSVCYGPFLRLTQAIQEISLCCLYYFSSLESMLLKSLVSCCLCQDLEPFLLFRIIEVLHSAYKAGNILTADYISFLITLLSRFRVSPEDCPLGHEGISNHATFRSITRVVCSYLPQIGDDYLVLQMLEKIILDQMSLKLALGNVCAFLRLLITLDSKPTRLSEQSIIKLSHVLPKYLLNVASSIPHDDESRASVSINNRHYDLLPCFFLFDRSPKLLDLFLTSLRSLITDNTSLLLSPDHATSKINHSSRLNIIVILLLLMHEDIKMRQILLPHKAKVEGILDVVLKLQSEDINTTIEERNRVQSACDRLKAAIHRSLSG